MGGSSFNSFVPGLSSSKPNDPPPSTGSRLGHVSHPAVSEERGLGVSGASNLFQQEAFGKAFMFSTVNP